MKKLNLIIVYKAMLRSKEKDERKTCPLAMLNPLSTDKKSAPICFRAFPGFV